MSVQHLISVCFSIMEYFSAALTYEFFDCKNMIRVCFFISVWFLLGLRGNALSSLSQLAVHSALASPGAMYVF